MKRTILTCIITLCSATGAIWPAHGAIYVLDDVSATTEYGYFNSTVKHSGTATINRQPGNGATVTTGLTPLSSPLAGQSIEWLSITSNGNAGVVCPGAPTKPKVTAYIDGDELYKREYELDFLYNAGIKDEPYKGTAHATRTKLEYHIPETVECANDSKPELSGTRTIDLLLQKWWDGSTPNQRKQTLKVNMVYRLKGTVSARFEPASLELHGRVGQYLTASTKLVINTQGGSQIAVAWPDVNDVEYYSDGGWTRGHTSRMPVSDGLTDVDKQLRIFGSAAGSRIISVPVTVTLT